MQELKEWFAERGLSGRVGFGQRPALLVVDVQRGFTDPRSGLGAEAPEAVAAIRVLVEQARAAGVLTIFTVCVWDEVARVWSRKLPVQSTLQPGSEWVELDPRLEVKPDDIVMEKHFASAFFGTELDAHLKAQHIDTVIVTGLTTSGCVRASVVDGVSYGYHIIVPADAVADRAVQPHESSLFDLDVKYADVVPSSAVIEYFGALTSG